MGRAISPIVADAVLGGEFFFFRGLGHSRSSRPPPSSLDSRWRAGSANARGWLLPPQVLVIIFSVISGLVSIYFLANREDGVTQIGEVRQALEWVTMFLWIVVCLLMAHLAPPVDSFRVSAPVRVLGPSCGSVLAWKALR